MKVLLQLNQIYVKFTRNLSQSTLESKSKYFDGHKNVFFFLKED